MSYELEIVREQKLKSVLELRTFFFKYHSEKIKGRLKGLNPHTLILNPPSVVNDADPFETNQWFAIYCRSYYVIIEQSRSAPLRGPHIAKLYIQTQRGKSGHWIGTATFKVNFTDTESIRVALRKAIRTRQYYVTEKTEEIMIDLTPPERKLDSNTIL